MSYLKHYLDWVCQLVNWPDCMGYGPNTKMIITDWLLLIGSLVLALGLLTLRYRAVTRQHPKD